MRYFIIVFLISALCFSGGCGSSKNLNTENVVGLERIEAPFVSITVPNLEKKVAFNTEEIFDSVSYIRLETTNNSLLTSVDQVVMMDSMLLVRDTYGTKSVKAFDLKGNYMFDIGRRGRGPGEYLEPTYVELVGDKITIYDQFKQTLLFYDHTGHFIHSRELPFLSMKFHAFSADNYIFHTISSDNDAFKDILGYDIFFADTLDVVTRRGFYRKKDTYQNLVNNHNFFAIDNLVYYHPNYNDTIYSITSDGEVKVEFAVDFGKKTVPEELRNGKNERKKEEMEATDRYSFMGGDFYLTDDYLLFKYTKAHSTVDCIYSLSTGKLVSIAPRHGFFPLVFLNVIGSTKDSFIGCLYPHIIFGDLEHWQNIPRDSLVSEFGEQLTDLGLSLKIDDNPLLTFYYPKKW